ncbi:hypothetical protein BKH42_03690 [Helicobacter sp. 13S00482-2]|uniref:hypothetical protein n=1 Tax=Helicobacter sp. 13S00482-2 TaxID=1476200 RepID=UPI000BA7D9F0|nr:hypothetical protein [Helicobacter sp. 13S00482-2]PAF53844.1 hypothetical protein BKH42_03690 [Helicobacter sp. 13S00482-2]
MLYHLKIKLFLVFLLMNAIQAQDTQESKYYCRADKNYQNYQSGLIKDLSSLTGYDTKEGCESNCFHTKACKVVETKIDVIKIANSKNININSINSSLSKNSGKIVGFEFMLSKENITLRDENPLSILELFKQLKTKELQATKARVLITSTSFKLSINNQDVIAIDKNSLISPIITAKYIYENGKYRTSITTNSYNSDGSLKKNTENKEGKIDFYKLVGVSFDSSFANINSFGASFKVPLERTADGYFGEKIINYEGSASNKVTINNREIIFITEINGNDLIKDVHYMINYNGSQYENFEISLLIKNNEKRYTCPSANLEKNIFSSKEACDNICKTSVSCQIEIPKPPLENDCTIEEQLLDGVGDIDGKYIYETKKIIKTCKKTRKKQIGCELYDYKTTFAPNAPNYLKNMPQLETNLQKGDFSKGVGVFAKASAAEQIAHMFSGEENYCDSGVFFDSPNWVEIGIKYGIMIGGPLVTQSGFSEAYKAGYKSGSNAITGFAKGVTAGVWNNVKGVGLEIVKNFTKAGFETFGEQIAKNAAIFAVSSVIKNSIQISKEIYKEKKFEEKFKDWERKYGAAYLSNGASAGANQKYIKSYEDLGGAHDEDDRKAANYAQCMSVKFRLFPQDIMNYYAGLSPDDLDDEEEKDRLLNLYYPTKSFVEITTKDLYVLKSAVEKDNANTLKEKEAYMNAHYSIKVDGNKILLKSLEPDDYRIAAETICGGIETIAFIRKKYGDRFLNPDLAKFPTAENLQKQIENPPPPPTRDDDDDDEKMGLKEIAKKALDITIQSLPIPYNLMFSVVYDYVDLFSEGNSCTDEDFAKKRRKKDSKRGEMFFKTNKRIASDLCFLKKTDDDIWHYGLFPSLKRDRDYYCCYDQKLTKIFAQGIMSQLGKNLNSESCSNLRIEDINKISFTECENGQDPQKDKCFPKDKFNELKETILQGGNIGSDELLGNIIKSTLQLKEKLEDPDPIDPKDIRDTQGGNM